MKDLRQIEAMAKAQPNKDRIQTSLSREDLRKAGLRDFGGKFTHSVRLGNSWKTFEVVPK